MPAAYPSITLKKRMTYAADGRTRLQIWVSASSDNIPSEIFLFYLLSPLPDILGPRYRYLGTCSYADMLNYPALAEDANTCYLRRASIDILFEARMTANAFWTDIQTGVLLLLEEIAELAAASPTTVTVNLIGS